jgi:hypothetical protein
MQCERINKLSYLILSYLILSLPYPVLAVVELPDEVVVGILLLPLPVLLLLVLKGIQA